MRETIRRVLGRLPVGFAGYERVSFGQEGEDMILSTFLQDCEKGFYVDVGAFHPARYSNTACFYLRGWRGINIDARPGSSIHFQRWRPRDINLELAIGREAGNRRYYRFEEGAYNGFLTEAEAAAVGRKTALIETIEMDTIPLAGLLRKHLPPNVGIDFMTIDVEGLEGEILETNDWELYRPSILCVEARTRVIRADWFSSPTVRFLHSVGYEVYAKTRASAFFIPQDQS